MPAQPASSPVSSYVSSLCAHSFAPTGLPGIYCAPGPETAEASPGFLLHSRAAPASLRLSPPLPHPGQAAKEARRGAGAGKPARDP